VRHAVSSPRTASVVHILSVHGGRNDKDKVHVLDDTHAALIQNLDIHMGSRKRRLGVSP
jgi:hypothetical protein